MERNVTVISDNVVSATVERDISSSYDRRVADNIREHASAGLVPILGAMAQQTALHEADCVDGLAAASRLSVIWALV
jgi:hypothetical protein